MRVHNSYLKEILQGNYLALGTSKLGTPKDLVVQTTVIGMLESLEMGGNTELFRLL